MAVHPTSQILSPASLFKNQITSPATATASAEPHGTSKVMGNSDSVVLDIITDGATCNLNVHGTRSSRTIRSSTLHHPVVELFERRELGKVFLEFAVSMTVGLLISQHQGLTHLQASAIMLALCVGFVTLWNGLLLDGICPRVARPLKYIGVGIILVAFFGLVSSFFPPGLVWACWFCCSLTGLPFLLPLVLPPAIKEESMAAPQVHGVV